MMNRFRECRERTNYSQKQVAIILGVKPPQISKWESGSGKPSRENCVKLAKLYGVTTDYLLGLDNEKEPDSDWLDNELLDRFSRLSPENRIRMDAYLQGLLASQEE